MRHHVTQQKEVGTINLLLAICRLGRTVAVDPLKVTRVLAALDGQTVVAAITVRLGIVVGSGGLLIIPAACCYLRLGSRRSGNQLPSPRHRSGIPSCR